MPDGHLRGDHDYVDIHRAAYLEKSVYDAERTAIDKRRKHIKNTGGRDRTACPLTGFVLSGGGIRSASFGLGALQALHVSAGIEGIDYLSTVSGGGYIGCSLTAAMQKTGGKFPFTNPDNYDDTDSVRHIRNYSNYLIPHSVSDAVTAILILVRGLVANVLIVLPILLFFAWFTLFTHPTVESLSKPKILFWNLDDVLVSLGFRVLHPLWGLHGFWFTAILSVATVISLVAWALANSISTSRQADVEVRGFFVTVSKALLFVTLVSMWFETQPLILRAMIAPSPYEMDVCRSVFSSNCVSAVLHGWFAHVVPWLLPSIPVFACLSLRNWKTPVMKTLAKAGLWFTAIIVPSFLWLVYLQLTYFGIASSDYMFSYAPGWLLSLADAAPFQGAWQKLGMTMTAGLYLEAFLMTWFLAELINPNTTSLHRLYRDRLSKAFLFDPDGRLDKHGDLPAYEPKLHQIDTNLCPYPIVNAALNIIQGSQYDNKRGRRYADFFIFAPEYTGSNSTGYIGTRLIEEDETALDLGTAMAISGAAVSSNMGAATVKALVLTSALFNIRLGYWVCNPRYVSGARSWLGRLIDGRGFYLIKEMFGRITETGRMVYLTDGGHIENLGVYPLLKRRCKVIIVIDAEADPAMSFGAFRKLQRYAQIDLGTIIELPWRAIRDQTLGIETALEEADESGSAIPSLPGPHCAAGEIQYGPNATGILIFVKASLTGDEPDYHLEYKRRNRAFPHDPTSDQFFNEEKLEAYRALGFHIMKGLLTGETPFAVVQDPKEPQDQKRMRILSTVRAALLGTAPKP